MIILKDEFQNDGIWNAYLVAKKGWKVQSIVLLELQSSYVESLEHIDQKA